MLTNNYVLSNVQLAHVLADGSAANAGVALDSHVIAKSHDHFLDLLGQLASRGQDKRLTAGVSRVDLLQDRNAEGGRFPGARLSLSDHVVPLDAGHNCPLLDGRRLLETVGINAAKQLLTEVHIVKAFAHLVPIGVDDALRGHSRWAIIGGGRFFRPARVPVVIVPGSGRSKIAKIGTYLVQILRDNFDREAFSRQASLFFPQKASFIFFALYG